MKKTLPVCLIFGFPPLTEGRPLSCAGDTMVTQENDESGHALSIDYTFNPYFAQIPK